MKHYLITIKFFIQDGEDDYEEYYIISANNLTEAGRVGKDFSDGIRECKIVSIKRITRKDEETLRKYGVI